MTVFPEVVSPLELKIEPKSLADLERLIPTLLQLANFDPSSASKLIANPAKSSCRA